MHSLQRSGSRWASPGGNIRGKVLAGGGGPGPAEAAGRSGSAASAGGGLSLALSLSPGLGRAQPAPPSRGARSRARESSGTRRGGPRIPGRPALPGGTRRLLLTRYRLLSRLPCFQTALLCEEVNVGCQSPSAAEGRGSARSGGVGNSRGQIPSPGAGSAQPTQPGGRGNRRAQPGEGPGWQLLPVALFPGAATSRPAGSEDRRGDCSPLPTSLGVWVLLVEVALAGG